MLRILVLALFASVLLAGCGAMPSKREPDSALAAERSFREGEFQTAAQGFLTAADDSRARRDYYRLRAAEAWREEGDLSQARHALEGVTTRKLGSEERLRLGLLQAEIALEASNAAEALTRLAFAEGNVPSAYRERFHYLRATALEQTGDGFGAAAERAQIDAGLAPADRADNARRIQELLSRLDDDTLFQRSAALPPGHPLYLHAGRILTSRGLELPRPYDRRAPSIDTTRPPADADGYRPFLRIALLLPQEGAVALAARAVRDGFMTAYYAEPRRRPVVRVYDSGATPEEAEQAYQQAASDGAQIVVGPLARDSVAAVFEGELPAPVLALNRGPIPPPPGSASFALAPEDEGVAAAERMLRRGWKRVIAVTGEDESAQRALGAFRERFAQRGGQLVAEVKLPESSPDYAPLIRGALNAAGAAPSGAGTLETTTTSISVGADAIFLAVRTAQARLFAPQLRVAGVYDLPILATSQIAAGGANARLDRELDGIEFAELPWLISDLPGVPARAPIAESLDSARGAGARLFAFGMDAFRLLGYLDQLGADPNARLSGATGELWLDGFGQVQRALRWARYSNGHVQPAPDGGLISDGVQFDRP